jgi:hypothetical protein
VLQVCGNNTKLQEGSPALRPKTEEWLLEESGGFSLSLGSLRNTKIRLQKKFT